MPHEFVVEKNGTLLTFDDYDKIPPDFDLLVKFLPELPECDHGNEQYQQQRQLVIQSWLDRFNHLMEIQNARSS